MIVKTGANYQNDGGYIEYAINGKYTVIGDNKIPTYTSRNSTEIISLMSVPIRKLDGLGAIKIYNYPALATTDEGVPIRYAQTYALTETYRNITLPTTFGAQIMVPTGNVPALAEGSHDVDISFVGGNYCLIVTGDSPTAVITYSEG